MKTPHLRISVIIAALLIIAYPILVHSAYLFQLPQLRLAGIIGVITGIFFSALIRGSRNAWLAYSIVIATICTLALMQSDIYIVYLPPIIIPLSLLIIFGRTLLPGQEALITEIGEASRGPLSDSMRHYTQKLTWAWCCIFVMMALWPIILLANGKFGLWSWFTNVFNYGIVSLIFIGEFYLRKKLFPNHNHPKFFEYLTIIYHANIRR